eukprot:CAMPEP_0118687956 /NCGR_PEP_ID=MMETSP0800-20121206/8662_1 /TAXON_ID=210618 ORGANISM="Striatella unipunctata, Strain CCMP2910" /NCGR_SAMPLE_ID=MMETSP0800 /ASSEMBLY_ACC=CAM_ASM_000638 /LENGTH=302 /DNA_ID=CAMNT_0006585181 /DNA_START=97 /DNA_END=1005 /DNA_ORIENTATION=+
MKVIIQYQDNLDVSLHKTLKITLPKSWKNGPTSKLLKQFVESYNGNEAIGPRNPLKEEDLHLEVVPDENSMTDASPVALASDATTIDVIPDRATLAVKHGKAPTIAELNKVEEEKKSKMREEKAAEKALSRCTHFGCQKRFPKGGPYPPCAYHKLPPVFHETAKFWSCCPNKKAYDWDDFQSIPGCLTGTCTDEKVDTTKQFLGGSDLREAAGEKSKLRSIDDFNKEMEGGGSGSGSGGNVLDDMGGVLGKIGVEKELFEQVIQGIKTSLGEGATDAMVEKELGKKLKSTFKSFAVEQLRIS